MTSIFFSDIFDTRHKLKLSDLRIYWDNNGLDLLYGTHLLGVFSRTHLKGTALTLNDPW